LSLLRSLKSNICFIGEGAFGKVAKCQVNSTSELVAVKIMKDTAGVIHSID
uniref:Protein kinase domain-containing protein n=1 Tax=Gouania willdenowi TaxID=441366 RepID=A0A8C5DXK3_GOUWI